jgi:putative transcriptional regulator
MNKFSKELIESLTEACEHAEGKPSGVRVHVVEVPDVRAIRRQLRMSQQEFARVYRIPLPTLKNWEQGRRQPDAPAAAYLQVIAKRPREAGDAEPRRPKPAATVVADDVKAFAGACVYARSLYMDYRAVFEDTPLDENPLKNLSPYFFGDLSRMFREHIILQVCKLTDPAADGRGNENLTVEFLTANADFSTDPAAGEELRARAEKIEQFRSQLKPARDKFISHLDRKSILNGRPLGGASADAWVDFWLDLQAFVKLLWKRCVSDESMYICAAAGSSDAVVMIQALRSFAASGLPLTA